MGKRLRGTLSAVLLGACAAGALAPTTAAAGTLDQQQLDGSDGDAFVNSTQSLAQTFTPARSGKLDQVDLSVRVTNAPVLGMTVEIRNTTIGSPGTTVLASQSIAPSAVAGTFSFVPIVFVAPAAVTAGTRYAIVAYSATVSPANYSLAKSTGDVYAGGDGLFVSASPPSGAWQPATAGGADFAFKTYVATPAAPTGKRAAARKKCKKKFPKGPKRKKCLKKASRLPI